jgi:hypothetical protein
MAKRAIPITAKMEENTRANSLISTPQMRSREKKAIKETSTLMYL